MGYLRQVLKNLLFLSFFICDGHRGLDRFRAVRFLLGPTPFASLSYSAPSSLSSFAMFSSYHPSRVTSLSPTLTFLAIHVLGALTVSIVPDSHPLNSHSSVLAGLSCPIGYHAAPKRL